MALENMQCWKLSKNTDYKSLLIRDKNTSTYESAKFRLTRIKEPTYRATSLLGQGPIQLGMARGPTRQAPSPRWGAVAPKWARPTGPRRNRLTFLTLIGP